MTLSRIALIAIFAVAALVRAASVDRPIDKASWRECDLGAVSKNFAVEGMDLFYPRIDWRGDGPGYAEMEFPLYPFITAISYQIFGIHDQIGRVWAFLFSLGTLIFFYRLAREYLDKWPALAAFAFFAFNPLVFETSTSVQPEGLMLMAYVGAVYLFVRWLRTGASIDLAGSAVMTALALLAKASAAHIGLLFGILLIHKYGWRAVLQLRLWLFAIAGVLPGALWYIHAKHLWTTYGNSLGVSNEYHWIGPDFFTNQYFISGILQNEFTWVWMSLGVLVAVFGVWRGRREVATCHSVIWLASVFIFYVLASRTTADEWAYYYHVFSVAPFAVLFGSGVSKLGEMFRETANSYSSISLSVKLLRGVAAALVTASMMLAFTLEARQVKADFQDGRSHSPGYVFAAEVKDKLTKPGLILASGGHCKDPDGYQVAYNASYMFYWLDRKGWNVCVEDQSAAAVRSYSDKGAVYFVAEAKYLRETPGLETELRQTYDLVADNSDFAVFDLTSAR